VSSGWRALVASDVRTDPGSPDPRLRGRTYTIPFEQVWNAALSVADGGLRGWKVVRSDDVRGVLEAEAVGALRRKRVNDVRVRVGLDLDGQTRVDAQMRGRKGSFDLGANRRRLRRFLAALDDRLGATPGQILEASRETSAVG
jgi:hypothetical protein